MKLGIVGGGAAGLMAAASAIETHPETEVFLIEKNDELGKKVMISGGGRCNVTTGTFDVRDVLKHYPRGEKFLSSAMHRFPPEQVYAWFEAHGVPLKIEEDLRAFPQSNDGSDVVRVFENVFRTGSVHVLLKTQAVKIERTAGGFTISFKDDRPPLLVDKLILTTGGQAYRQTGSTGDGYAFAQSLGHTITSLAPSLSAFYTTETWPADISGLSFQKAKITAKCAKNPSYSGPFLFTHKGVSGPAIFALSSIVAFEPFDGKKPLEIAIDLFPEETAEELTGTVERNMKANGKKSFENALIGIIPKSLSAILFRQLKIPKEKRAGDVNKKEIASCVAWLKGIPLHVVARGAGDEFVTAGGVDLKEVNPSTMESKICPGLFFAGEILDIDGFTGGFNLQASWATGRLAGES